MEIKKDYNSSLMQRLLLIAFVSKGSLNKHLLDATLKNNFNRITITQEKLNINKDDIP